jgi:hypothetical protein
MLLRGLCEATNSGRESCILSIGGVVADAETFTLGSKTYELMVVDTAGIALANPGGGLGVSAAATDATFASAHGLSVGEVIRIESEFCKVSEVLSTTSVRLVRGYAGSTAATHADNTATKIVASHRLPVAGRIAVPVWDVAGGGTITAGEADDLVIAAINYFGVTEKRNTARATLGANNDVHISRAYGEDAGIALGINVGTGGIDDSATALPISSDASGVAVGDYLKVESEYVKVTAIAAFKQLTVARAQLGSSAAAHAAGTAIMRVAYWNSETMANGTITQFSGGCDVAGFRRDVWFRAVIDAEATAGIIVCHVAGTVKGVAARVFDASAGWAAMTDVTAPVVAGTNNAPAEVTVTEGATAWAAGDYVFLEVWYV